jgi:hypothetical protein
MGREQSWEWSRRQQRRWLGAHATAAAQEHGRDGGWASSGSVIGDMVVRSRRDLRRHGLGEPREGRVRASTSRTTRHDGRRLSTPTTSTWSSIQILLSSRCLLLCNHNFFWMS